MQRSEDKYFDEREKSVNVHLLMEQEWKSYRLSVLGKIESGRDIYASERIDGDIPYITSGSQNNGIGYFVSNKNDTLDKDYIAFNRNGSVGLAFYHPYWSVMGNDCRKIHLYTPDKNINIGLFISASISMQRKSFSYSRKLGTARASNLQIMLPVADSSKPDYGYMEEYTRQRRAAMLKKYRTYAENRIAQIGKIVDIPKLNEKIWDRFKVFGDNGFPNIATTSSSIDSIRIIDGDDKTLPYVTRSDSNNGIARFVSKKNMLSGHDDAGCITVGLDTQTAFWQPYEFVTGQNIQVITGDILNKYIASFLIPLLSSQMRAKFNWGGNGATLKRMKALEMMLPVNGAGKPDFAYMEQYAKNMMARKYTQYLSFLDRMSKGAL